ncbi:MAG: 1-acyl-sn-glycerol-3-phosphate acyltransferase [Pseudonocardiales bacterium]|nr:MAG: 1-acyl-sn-glycerol-3-phosphate acyltransferase [Pseudonocardiales bacterium]
MSDLTYRVVNRVFRLFFRVLGLRIEVRGAEHIPLDGPAVLACNHTGFLDFSFVGLAAADRSRLVRFMAKRATFDHPLSGPLMRRMGHIRVDRACGAVAYRQAARALQDGQVVGLFPEATISRAWTLKAFKHGAASLAVAEQVPLVPMVVWGSHRLSTVDGRGALRRGVPIMVLVGEPILAAVGADVTAVNAELRRRIQDLLDEAQVGYPDRPRDEQDRWWLPRHFGGSAPTPEAAVELDAAGMSRADSLG